MANMLICALQDDSSLLHVPLALSEGVGGPDIPLKGLLSFLSALSAL